MAAVCKVNILLKHILAREGCCVCINVIQLGLIGNKLIVFRCRTRRISRRIIGRRGSTIADMCIAAVGSRQTRGGCIRIHFDGIGRCHIRRIEESDVGAVHLDGIRRDLAHVDHIGFERGGIDKRRSAASRKVCLIERRFLLRGDIEIPDIDLRRLAEDDAVRIDDVDILAAHDLAVDVRGVCARDDVQIVIRLVAAVMHDTFPTGEGIVPPLNDIVRIRGTDIGIITAARDRCSATDNILPRRRSKCDLRNQKSARHACEQCIAHTLR